MTDEERDPGAEAPPGDEGAAEPPPGPGDEGHSGVDSGADAGAGAGVGPSQIELGPLGGEEPIVPRVYYSIGEVCDLAGLKPHVLRYWETQFEVMNPNKNRAGNRVYRPKDIDLIFLVKRLLYEEKYTIEGARQRLVDMRREGELDQEKQDVLGPEFLSEIRRELRALKKTLTLPDSPD